MLILFELHLYIWILPLNGIFFLAENIGRSAYAVRMYFYFILFEGTSIYALNSSLITWLHLFR